MTGRRRSGGSPLSRLSDKHRERNGTFITNAWVRLCARASFKALPQARQDEMQQLHKRLAEEGEVPTEATKQIRAVEQRWAAEDAAASAGGANG